MDRACQGFVCRRAYFYSIDLNLVGSTASTYDTNQHDCYNGEDFPMARMALFLRAAIFVLFVPLACLADPTTWPPATDWIEIRRNGNRRFRGNNGMWTDSAQADRRTETGRERSRVQAWHYGKYPIPNGVSPSHCWLSQEIACSNRTTAQSIAAGSSGSKRNGNRRAWLAILPRVR